jgi:uncharacterized protein (DUF2141 family)
MGRTTRFTRGAALAICLGVSLQASAQPVRDAASPSPAAGTASISGTIVTDDTSPQPLRRARVALTSADRTLGRVAITDDAGRFSFAGLPAGRYQLMAMKQGYVTGQYGAKRPNRPGTAIVLTDGQRMPSTTLRLTRGGVISGVLLDQSGDPFAGATVYSRRSTFAGAGQRQLIPGGSAQTNDRGEFRIWGLAAGEYTILAAGTAAPGSRTDVDITRLTDADVQRAMTQLGSASPAPSRVTAATVSSSPARAASTVGYAPVFYPGTFSASQATPVKIGPGEERAGVDFSMALVRTARVEGTLAVPEGFNASTIGVQMVGNNPAGMLLDSFRRTTPAADGTFTFAGVAPGTYTVVARGQAPTRSPAAAPQGRPGTPPQPTHYATADVAVDGQDVSGLSLTLQPGLIVAGRVQFEGTALPLPDLSRLRINLAPLQSQGEVTVGIMQIAPDANGAFSIQGVPPGRYRLLAAIPTPRPDPTGWQIKSSTIGGRDTLDAPIDLKTSIDDAVITFIDRPTELNGMVQDPAGQPAPEYQVVVFSTDKGHWLPQSRRIRSVKPAADGKYTIPNLPPGEYHITAVIDIEPGEWYDPALLEQLSRVAFKITLAEGEKKTQDLRLASQRP